MRGVGQEILQNANLRVHTRRYTALMTQSDLSFPPTWVRQQVGTLTRQDSGLVPTSCACSLGQEASGQTAQAAVPLARCT